MAKEINVLDIDPDAVFMSLLEKINTLVGLEKALIQMYEIGIDHHASNVVQLKSLETRQEIESMLNDLKERFILLKDGKLCTHGDDPYNPVV